MCMAQMQGQVEDHVLIMSKVAHPKSFVLQEADAASLS